MASRWSYKQLTPAKWAWTSSRREPSETARQLHPPDHGAHQLLPLHAILSVLVTVIRFRVIVFLDAKVLHSVWDCMPFSLFTVSAVVLLLL
jgi:hypothetical protein